MWPAHKTYSGGANINYLQTLYNSVSLDHFPVGMHLLSIRLVGLAVWKMFACRDNVKYEESVSRCTNMG